jgi:acetyl-CoA acetyltransferase
MKDGLWDVYNDVAIGVCAEICADNHNITREAQVYPPIFPYLPGQHCKH